MPNRILREGINSSPRVDQLSSMAELLYRRLMSVVDDFGRYYATPRTVAAACWPTHPSPPSDAEVGRLLAECAEPAINLLAIYEVRGQPYLEITGFDQRTRSKSKFPQRVDNPPSTRGQMPADCAQVADNPPQSASTTRARTSPPTTNALRQTHDADNPPQSAVAYDSVARFREFLEPWPRVANPDHAARCWISVVDSAESEAAAFAARDRYLASDEVSRGVITDPTRWLGDQKSAGWAGKWPAAVARMANGKASTVDRVLAKMQERIANGERPL